MERGGPQGRPFLLLADILQHGSRKRRQESRMRSFFVTAAVGVAALLASTGAWAGKDLDTVRARGTLLCGVAAAGLAGFMSADSKLVNQCQSCQV
jgi:hypothetical protein